MSAAHGGEGPASTVQRPPQGTTMAPKVDSLDSSPSDTAERDTTQPPRKKARTHEGDVGEGSSSRMIVTEAGDRSRAVQDDEGEDGDEGNDSTTKTYCVCQALYDEERMMIACDRCDEWFHTVCMNIAEDEVELVDVFICPHCAKEDTMQHTTYKPKCLRAECKRAALKPLSRYCSERCGILVAGMRIYQAGRLPVKSSGVGTGTAAATAAAKKLADKLLQSGRVSSAKRREGIVMWEGDAGTTDSIRARMQYLSGSRTRAQFEAELRAAGIGQDQHDIVELQAILPLLEELNRAHEESRDAQRKRNVTNATLDLLAARTKLLQLAEDRAATLEPVSTTGDDDVDDGNHSKSKKSKGKKKGTSGAAAAEEAEALPKARGQPRCGYDERLGWDDERFGEWARGEAARSMLDEAVPLDGRLAGEHDDTQGAAMDVDQEASDAARVAAPPSICGQVKRKCRRHADWSAMRGADFEYERELQTQHLSRLAEQTQQCTTKISALQREARRTLEELQLRRRNADETLARRLAAEGTRRAPLC